MELRLGLALPATDPLPHWLQPRKRALEDSLSDDRPQTLPLLVWDSLQPTDKDRAFSSNNGDLEGDDAIVGWPPLKAQRKNLYSRNAATESRYVKVKMEGVAIGRKIDMNTCASFLMLKRQLCSMFAVEDDHESYVLTYQDVKGRWLSAENNEGWRDLNGLVQRLKLVKCTSY